MNLNDLKQFFDDYPDYRWEQARTAIFQQKIRSWNEASTLPKKIRQELKQKFPLRLPGSFLTTADGKTTKAVLDLADGLQVETVLMRYDNSRNTVCVSTQVGCSLGCEFCATGDMGFKRNLTAGEIISQVLYFSRKLPSDERIDNVVFMGMGEPFLNYGETLKALRLLNNEKYFNIGARNMSVSTAGIVPGIKLFAEENIQVNLAISLNAADDQTRSSLMPVNRQYPLVELFHAIDYYIAKTNRKVMFEYILLKGINDGEKDIRKLVGLLRERMHFLNLIPYNPTERFISVSATRLQEFKHQLEKAGLNVGIRRSFGQKIKAACGQLACDSSK